MRVAITGASGFTGAVLATALRAEATEVVTVGRGKQSDIRWDPDAGKFDPQALAGVDAVVHLAGAPIGERWTSARKRAIRESRVRGTRLIAEAIAQLPGDRRPRSLICASGAGIYGINASRGGEWLDETSPPGTDFLAGVARDWEAAAGPAQTVVRVVYLRNGLVLNPHGGALAKMLPAFRLGGGGRLASGEQWMSWIALHDWVRIVQFALAAPTLSGAVNAVAPNPVTNAEFTTTLAHVLKRPALAVIPEFILRGLFGEMAQATLLASQRVRPTRLTDAGFTFAFPFLDAALKFELAT